MNGAERIEEQFVSKLQTFTHFLGFSSRRAHLLPTDVNGMDSAQSGA